MAPFGSMGFAADGGVEMGGVVSSDGGRGTLQIQNSLGDMAPSGDFTHCVWSLLLISGRFGSFCVFLQLSSHGVGLCSGLCTLESRILAYESAVVDFRVLICA